MVSSGVLTLLAWNAAAFPAPPALGPGGSALAPALGAVRFETLAGTQLRTQLRTQVNNNQ